ncbi:MAG TPA: hypothetical protein EYM41_03485 [Dehalococcoidia bacterium]|nr:hypothetical protein [Dehalococcoidia bacterium]
MVPVTVGMSTRARNCWVAEEIFAPNATISPLNARRKYRIASDELNSRLASITIRSGLCPSMDRTAAVCELATLTS